MIVVVVDIHLSWETMVLCAMIQYVCNIPILFMGW